MAPNTTDLISIGAFRVQQAAAGVLKPNEATDAVLGLLAHAMRRALPEYAALAPRDRLHVFLEQVAAHDVYRHRRPIRQALKNPALADDLFISRPTLRVYRTRAYRLLDALEVHFGHQKAPSHPELMPAWDALVQTLQAEPSTKLLETAFKRFAAFASARDWMPPSLTEERILEFQRWLEDESGLHTHARYYRQARKAWMWLVEQGHAPECPFPPRRKSDHIYGLRREDLPEYLRAVLTHYAHCAMSDDPDERTGPTALAERSLALHEATLLDYWGFLKNVLGVALADQDLPALWAEDYLKAFHRFAIERAGGKAMQWHMRRMFFLRAFARDYISVHWGAVDLEWMAALFHKTTAHERKEHAPVYDRPLVEQTLVHMAAQIADARERSWPMHRQIALHTTQFAIAFLADHPLRSTNILQAHLGREVDMEKRTFRVCTKNGQTLHEQISPQAWQYLQDYLALRRQAGIHSTALLVSAQGAPLSYASLYRQITTHFEQATQVHFTPHAFRYLAVGEALEHTGDPVYAGAAIGDRSSRVVEKSYNRYAPAQAAAEWHALRQAFREGRPEALPPPVQVLLRRAEEDPTLKAMLLTAMEEIEQGGQRHVA